MPEVLVSQNPCTDSDIAEGGVSRLFPALDSLDLSPYLTVKEFTVEIPNSTPRSGDQFLSYPDSSRPFVIDIFINLIVTFSSDVRERLCIAVSSMKSFIARSGVKRAMGDNLMRPKIASRQHISREEDLHSAAPGYDQDSSPATQRARRIMVAVFRRYFHKGQSLLELNCGTGTDAVALARHGCRVHATDTSPEMVKAAERRIGKHNPESMITTGVLPLDDLGRLGGYVFDGAYSNFGGLNYVSDLWIVARDLSELVTPGGCVVLCLMTSVSLWETIALFARARFKEAFRRRSTSSVLANVHGQLIRAYYHSPRKVAKTFEPKFACVEIGGLNIFTPPPSSGNAHRVLGRASYLLERLDDLLSRVAPFSRWGKHFYIVLRRI